MHTWPSRHAEKGATLIELAVLIGILIVVLAASVQPIAHALGRRRSLTTAISAAVHASRSVASANGATLLVEASDAFGHTRFSACPGRPSPSASGFGEGCHIVLDTEAVVSLVALGSAPWAIFFDPSGSASAAAWKLGDAIAAEPTCSGSFAIAIDGAPALSLDCATGDTAVVP